MENTGWKTATADDGASMNKQSSGNPRFARLRAAVLRPTVVLAAGGLLLSLIVSYLVSLLSYE